MTLQDQIMYAIKSFCEQNGGPIKAAQLLGISEETLKTWYYGKKIPRLETLSKHAEKMGIHFQTNTSVIRRLGAYSPVEEVQGENLPTVPVMGATGAGNAVDFFNAEPEYCINVLPQYALSPRGIGLVVMGDSMEPTICKGAIVGVEEFDGSITPDCIYLVHIEPFGRTIKRIRMGDNGSIVLHSDNANVHPVTIPTDGYEKKIIGRIVWVWQKV